MFLLTLLVSIVSIRGAFALTGLSYLPTNSLPEGICQVRFHDYEFKPYNGKTPRLGVLACTASFLTQRMLLLSAHCHLDVAYYKDDRGVETSRRLDAKTIDIACAKKQVLHRRLEVKKRHRPDSFQLQSDWNIPDPDLMIVELKKDFPTRIEPLIIAENPNQETNYVDIFGYGRTDSRNGAIELLGEPLNVFTSEIERAHYHRTLTDLYKGTRITEFREMNLSRIAELSKDDPSYPDHLGPIALANPARAIRLFLELMFYPKIEIDRDNTPIKLGDSGGPVLDSNGQIIAVNTMATRHHDSNELQKLRGFATRLTQNLREWIHHVIAQ